VPIFVTSLDDPRLAHYRHIGNPSYLREHGLFVAEGRLVVRRLLSDRRWRTESVLVTRAAFDSLMGSIEPAESAEPAEPVFIVEQSTLNTLVGFNIHRGCLALAARPPERWLTNSEVAGASRVLVLEGVNNPDNVGGIFRSAAAFGIELVVLGPSCGDPLYRKAIRTSMASTLTVPFAFAEDWPSAIHLLRAVGLTVIALTPDHRATPLASIGQPARAALLVGAEGEGLSAAALEAAEVRARIPMTDQVDSLNVTTAASIAMYHVFGGAS
jgi:tRNA G18 (ribose-2'-O)-methylase SpoU